MYNMGELNTCASVTFSGYGVTAREILAWFPSNKLSLNLALIVVGIQQIFHNWFHFGADFVH